MKWFFNAFGAAAGGFLGATAAIFIVIVLACGGCIYVMNETFKTMDETKKAVKEKLRKQQEEKAKENQQPAAKPQTKPQMEYRTWTSGQYTTEAALVRMDGMEAVLRKRNGKDIAIARSRLSKADNDYIDAFISKQSNP